MPAMSMPQSGRQRQAAEPLVTRRLSQCRRPSRLRFATTANAFSSDAPAIAEAGLDRQNVAPVRQRRKPLRRSCPAPGEEKQTNPVTRWLFGGNTLVRVGMVVLFSASLFCLNMPPSAICSDRAAAAAVAAGAIALLAGWRLRESRSGYALILGWRRRRSLSHRICSVAALSTGLAEFAFAVPVGIASCSAMLAVLQDSCALAITCAAGGFSRLS